MSGWWHQLLDGIRDGRTRELARACRLVEERVEGYRELLASLPPCTAWTIGVTGAPGAGKSTLTAALIRAFREQQMRVAVLAVDPSSPFTGGSILGDRIRMQSHFLDEGVFIRSSATRGVLGGLSASAWDIAQLMSVWGAQVVLMETVGVGQAELDVARGADTALVVMAPGLGDDVQATKAGLLEVADVFAVNKADKDGASALHNQLEGMLLLGDAVHTQSQPIAHGTHSAPRRGEPVSDAWQVPILDTVAITGSGLPELTATLQEHRRWFLSSAAESLRARRMQWRLEGRVRSRVTSALEPKLQELVTERILGVLRGELTESEAEQGIVRELIARLHPQSSM